MPLSVETSKVVKAVVPWEAEEGRYAYEVTDDQQGALRSPEAIVREPSAIIALAGKRVGSTNG